MRRRDDAVEEQHDLRALAHHRDGDDARQRGERALAEPHCLADLAHFGRHGAGVVRHPQDVPAQHDHGETQDRRGEDFLAGALERIGQGGGEYGHQAGAGDPRRDPAGDPAAAPGDPLGRGEDDADDQPGLHRLAEDDDHADEHGDLFPSSCIEATSCGGLSCVPGRRAGREGAPTRCERLSDAFALTALSGPSNLVVELQENILRHGI